MAKQVETSVKKRRKREAVQSRVITTLARLTSQNARTSFAPEIILIKKLDLPHESKWRPVYQLRQAARQLEKKGIVEFDKNANGWAIRLTQKGERFAEILEAKENIKIKKRKNGMADGA